MRAKRIFLNVLPESSPGAGDTFIYRDALLEILGGSRADGYTIAQMRTRMALIDSLKGTATHWDVDHREHEALIKELENRKWGRPSPNLLKFIDDLRDAPDAVVPNEGNVVKYDKDRDNPKQG